MIRSERGRSEAGLSEDTGSITLPRKFISFVHASRIVTHDFTSHYGVGASLASITRLQLAVF